MCFYFLICLMKIISILGSCCEVHTQIMEMKWYCENVTQSAEAANKYYWLWCIHDFLKPVTHFLSTLYPDSVSRASIFFQVKYFCGSEDSLYPNSLIAHCDSSAVFQFSRLLLTGKESYMREFKVSIIGVWLHCGKLAFALDCFVTFSLSKYNS